MLSLIKKLPNEIYEDHENKDTIYKHSAKAKSLSMGKPNPTLRLLYSNKDDTIQDPFDLEKSLLQEPR